MESFDKQKFLESHLAVGEDIRSARFPELSTLSPAFFYPFVPVAKKPSKPEVVFVPSSIGSHLELTGLVAGWNFLWEAGKYRKETYIHRGEARVDGSLFQLESEGYDRLDSLT